MRSEGINVFGVYVAFQVHICERMNSAALTGRTEPGGRETDERFVREMHKMIDRELIYYLVRVIE